MIGDHTYAMSVARNQDGVRNGSDCRVNRDTHDEIISNCFSNVAGSNSRLWRKSDYEINIDLHFADTAEWLSSVTVVQCEVCDVVYIFSSFNEGHDLRCIYF